MALNTSAEEQHDFFPLNKNVLTNEEKGPHLCHNCGLLVQLAVTSCLVPVIILVSVCITSKAYLTCTDQSDSANLETQQRVATSMVLRK